VPISYACSKQENVTLIVTRSVWSKMIPIRLSSTLKWMILALGSQRKRELVFEDYVQVKEGQGGTGLGLGIVQSFVSSISLLKFFMLQMFLMI